MSRALVTGGAGFIGSHLASRLLEVGYEVRVLDNLVTGRRENLDAVRSEIEIVEGDIRSSEIAAKAVAGCELVFHEAALPSVPRSIADPAGSASTNVMGTLNVLIAAREHGVRRVVSASSSSVYGANPLLPKIETMEPMPISPYATAKLAGEGFCRSFAVVHGIETVSLRYFNVFGPRQDPTSQYSAVIPAFVHTLLRGERPTINGDGEQSRDFTYVDDVVSANLLAADCPVAAGDKYNVSSGRRATLNALYAELVDLLELDVPARYGPPRDGDIRHSHASIEAAYSNLGYTPSWSLRDGLARTIEHIAATFRLELLR